MTDKTTSQTLDTQFGDVVGRWQTWLETHHLTRGFTFLLDIIEPLALLGAQFLYVLQPSLGLFMERQTIDQWARLMESPGGIAWLREKINMPSTQLVEPMDEQHE